jgi:hypothetical protein
MRLSVLPFGSRHVEARRYSEENIERRLHRNHLLRNSLAVHRSNSWESHSNGLLVPSMSINIEIEKAQQLLALVVRGLFMFHWKDALDPNWFADSAIFHPDYENRVIEPLLPYMGEPAIICQRDLGRGTFVYRGMRSVHIPQLSFWQLTIFGGLQFGGDSRFPNYRFTKFSIVTRQTEAAAHATRARAEKEKMERSRL